jgi:hypothetical protein
VLTAAAPLQAIRAALREPRRTLTELGDGGPQGEQSLTPAGAPGAPVSLEAVRAFLSASSFSCKRNGESRVAERRAALGTRPLITTYDF